MLSYQRAFCLLVLAIMILVGMHVRLYTQTTPPLGDAWAPDRRECSSSLRRRTGRHNLSQRCY